MLFSSSVLCCIRSFYKGKRIDTILIFHDKILSLPIPLLGQNILKNLFYGKKERIYQSVCGSWFQDSGRTDKVRTDIILADRDTGKQMSNVFREIFIEMPLFKKTESECETPLDYWLYNLKHMEQLETLSFKGQKELFNRLEQLAKIANMNKKEREEYEECLKVYRDNYSIALYQKQQAEARYQEGREEGIEIGEERGLKKGREEGILATARLMKQNGISFEQIKLCTGLTEEEISNL